MTGHGRDAGRPEPRRRLRLGLYWTGRFEPLAAMLPRLLAEAAAATHDATTPEAGRAAELGECGLDLPEARIISVEMPREDQHHRSVYGE